MPKRLVILGATGSIGVQALDVVASSGGELEVVGLSAGRDWEQLLAQARRFGVDRIALADSDAAARAAEAWTDGEVLAGPVGRVELVPTRPATSCSTRLSDQRDYSRRLRRSVKASIWRSPTRS